MLDSRIPLGVQPINIEPRSNALMRAAQLQGQQDQNALRQAQMAQIKAQAEEALRARAAQEAQQQQMNAYLQSMSGQAGPPEPFNPGRAAQMFGIDGAKKLQDLMTPKQDNYKVVGSSLVQVGPNGVIEAYRAPDKPAPKSPLAQLMAERDALPQGDPRRAVYDAQIRKTTTHSPPVNVSVSSGDKGYVSEISKLVAKQDADAIDAAQSAPDRIRSAQDVKRILRTEKPMTGTAADWRLEATKALSTAGIIDGQSVKSTEDLASLLASQTLEAIKSSGLGSGQGFTDKDRQFLERARAGQITMNADTLYRLADLNEKAGRRSIERGNAAVKRLNGIPGVGEFVNGREVKQPAQFSLPTADDIAAEMQRRGIQR